MSKGLLPFPIENDGMSEATLYRKSTLESEFILFEVSFHFQDPGWSVAFSVGDGFPEKASDPVELLFASVNLEETGLVGNSSSGLQYDIDVKKLRQILSESIDYCIRFISGDTENALKIRRERNHIEAKDPLKLHQQSSWMNNEFNDRNEELKLMLRKYF